MEVQDTKDENGNTVLRSSGRGRSVIGSIDPEFTDRRYLDLLHLNY
jgi:hypothetical protein